MGKMDRKENNTKCLRIFDGAVAIVTGGASGIGRALAEALVRKGAEVVLVDLQGDPLEKVVSEIQASGGKASAVQADVTDPYVLKGIVRDTVKGSGRLDYFFNIAGIIITGMVAQHSMEDWERIININLGGVINGVQAAFPVMVAQGYGHIVNMASLAGLIPIPGAAAYTATKHAVVGLSAALRIEAALLGIRVTTLCPGIVRTPLAEHGGTHGKMYTLSTSDSMKDMEENLKPMDPVLFVEKALRAIAHNKAVFIGRTDWALIWRSYSLFPDWGKRISQKILKNMLIKTGLMRGNG
jgi:NAD(P)-dependent dehydrogenase (short-subunit alcohol dehydrogenase family)